jgi:hypothetical protein
MAVQSFIKFLLGRMFKDYRINMIVASRVKHYPAAAMASGCSVTELSADHIEQFSKSTTGKIRSSLSYSNAGLQGYVLVHQGVPVCVTHFADTEQYDRASTWPLKANEVALMDIATEEFARGKSYASALIGGTTERYTAKGTHRLIAFIWWSNTPSKRAFAKAGWRKIGLSIEVKIAGQWRGMRVPLSLQ